MEYENRNKKGSYQGGRGLKEGMKEELQRIREGRGRSKDKYCVFSCVKHMCKDVFVCMEAGRGLWGRGKGP